MPRLLRSALVLTYMSETMAYCLPTQPCWPSSSEWESLGRVLTGTLTATATENWAECLAAAADSDAIAIASSANGICMQDTNCAYEYCDGDNAGKWDLPQVTAAVADVEDIKSVLSFCNQHNISVTVKTSGHSYAGSSTMKGSLLIWLHNLTKFGTVGPLTDSCGEVYQDVLKIGGGQPWGDAYLASAAAGRELVGGGGLTVSAAGGWLMGGGLSALSRKFGYGVDNVLRLEVVTTDAEAIVVDACSHGELFWALRGGGGGSFGVVTAAYYRTHEPAPVVTLSMNIDVSTAERDWWLVGPILESWIDFWVERSPSLSRDWAGGYWTLSSIVVLYYRGPLAEARATFIEPLEQWKASLTDWQQTYVTISVGNHTSFWASRTAACAVGMPEAGSAACLKYGATTDATGNANTNLRSRIVTHEYATRNGGADAKAALKWMLVNGFFTFNYFLGGAVNDVAPNATSVHPSVRASVWNWQVFDPRLVARMEAELPDSGICYNHAGHDQVVCARSSRGLSRLALTTSPSSPLAPHRPTASLPP